MTQKFCDNLKKGISLINKISLYWCKTTCKDLLQKNNSPMAWTSSTTTTSVSHILFTFSSIFHGSFRLFLLFPFILPFLLFEFLIIHHFSFLASPRCIYSKIFCNWLPIESNCSSISLWTWAIWFFKSTSRLDWTLNHLIFAIIKNNSVRIVLALYVFPRLSDIEKLSREMIKCHFCVRFGSGGEKIFWKKVKRSWLVLPNQCFMD